MSTADHQSLTEAHERRMKALLDADTTALAEVVSEDMNFVSPTGTILTRPEVVAAFEAGTMRIERMDCSEISIRIYGDMGILMYRAMAKTRMGDTVLEGDTRSTSVYVRNGDSWKMVSQHQSRVE